MAVGRISGPLLKSNLIRNGIDLAFETNLLYLDVIVVGVIICAQLHLVVLMHFINAISISI